jgi:DNA adenine methylase
VFAVLRDPASALRLKEIVALTPFARDEFKLAHEWSEEPVERARRAVIRAFMGFGSNSFHGKGGMRTRSSPWTVCRTGFRANAKRQGTTPASDWASWPDSIPGFIERLRGVVIENRDALEIMRQHDGAETLYYLDPPYLMTTRSSRDQYTFELDEDGHRELAEVARSMVGSVVISGYHSELYEDLYRGWVRVERPALADGARPRTEVLWLSPRAHRSLRDSRNSLFDLLGPLV